MILELLGRHKYARPPGIGTAALLDIPESGIIPSEVQVDGRAYILRESLSTMTSAVGLVLDITGIHTFCKEFDIRIEAHCIWTAAGDRWAENPFHLTGCSFNISVQTAELFYLTLLRHKHLKAGLAIAMSIEPSQYVTEEKPVFDIDVCAIWNGTDCIPYEGGRNIFHKTINSWKRKKDFALARSIASNVILPHGLSVISIITRDKVAVSSSQPSTNPSE